MRVFHSNRAVFEFASTTLILLSSYLAWRLTHVLLINNGTHAKKSAAPSTVYLACSLRRQWERLARSIKYIIFRLAAHPPGRGKISLDRPQSRPHRFFLGSIAMAPQGPPTGLPPNLPMDSRQKDVFISAPTLTVFATIFVILRLSVQWKNKKYWLITDHLLIIGTVRKLLTTVQIIY